MSHEEDALKNEICRIMKILHEDGLLTATGGNVSARLPNSQEVWITPSGLYKAELNPDELVKIDSEGNIIEGTLKPSIEKLMHLTIYKKRADVNGIVHSHPPFSTSLAVSNVSIEPITVTAALRFPKVPVVRYAMPGSTELAELVAKEVSSVDTILLLNHGLITVGSKLRQALYLAQCLEETAKVILATHILGRRPTLISEKDVKQIRKIAQAMRRND